MDSNKNPLKTLRDYFGYTQEEVGAAIGKKQSAYSDLENGVTKFTMALKRKLADFYKVDIRVFTESLTDKNWIEYMNPEPSTTLAMEEMEPYQSNDKQKNVSANELINRLELELMQKNLNAQLEMIEKMKREIEHLTSENSELRNELKKQSGK